MARTNHKTKYCQSSKYCLQDFIEMPKCSSAPRWFVRITNIRNVIFWEGLRKQMYLSGKTESWGWEGFCRFDPMPIVDKELVKDPLLVVGSLLSIVSPKSKLSMGTASSKSCWGPTSPGTAVSLLMYLKYILSLRVLIYSSNSFFGTFQMRLIICKIW